MAEHTCQYCSRPMVWLGCEYPFWYHEGDTPRHGDWVPDHGCVADASKVPAGTYKGCRDEDSAR